MTMPKKIIRVFGFLFLAGKVLMAQEKTGTPPFFGVEFSCMKIV